jgi:two-component system response regulator (stage 0 sporulation protein A)
MIIISEEREAAEEAARCFSAYGCSICAIGTTGREALELVSAHQPDVLITDPFLPFYNCDELAAFLEKETPAMVKIALSDEKNDRLAQRFMEQGGDLFLIRPLDYAFCLKRIEKYHLLRTKQKEFPADATPERQIIRRLQMRMKMPVSIHGFLYVQEAVELIVKDPSILQRMVSDVYPSVGARFNVGATCVERCIRTVIANTFQSGDLPFLERYFYHACGKSTGSPQNKEFLGIFAELVRQELAAAQK